MSEAACCSLTFDEQFLQTMNFRSELANNNNNNNDNNNDNNDLFTTDIGMAFGTEKCAALKITRVKVVESEGIELPNGDTIKELEENDGYKYLSIVECDKIKNSEMKEEIKKEYFRRVKLILKSKLNAGNVVMAVNNRAVSLVRYCAGIVDWTKAELQEMEQNFAPAIRCGQTVHQENRRWTGVAMSGRSGEVGRAQSGILSK